MKTKIILLAILLVVSLFGCHQEETENTLTTDVESGIMNTTDESNIIKNTEEPYIIKTYEETTWELMPEYAK